MNIKRTIAKITLTTATLAALAAMTISHHTPQQKQRGCAFKDIQSILTATTDLIKYAHKEEPTTQPHYSFNNEPRLP